MYASAWIFVIAPMVVSFSTSEPRPTTTSSPSVTRSRMHAWSPTITRSPIVVPAKTTAPVEITLPAPIWAGERSSRFDVERGDRTGCFPTTAYSSTRTPSPSTVPGWTTAVGWISADTEGVGQPLQRPHHHRAVARHLLAVAVAVDEAEEVLALEPERLGRGDLRDEDVAAPRLPLAVGLGAFPRRLVVDRHLAIELHVVEHRHLVPADHSQPPHLVRVEPREVHVCDLPGREAQVAEDDVLDPVLEEVAALGRRRLRLLVEQVEDDREVVDAERPERVLVGAHDPQVLAVAVDAQHLAELAAVDQLLQLQDSGVVEQEVAGHQHEVAVGGERNQLVHLLGAHGRGLLDQDVFPGL